MAQVKPLDLAIVETWLSAWNEREIFSDAAVRHLQSLITDPFCFVVVTLGVGREPRGLVFRRMKGMIPVLVPPLPALKPTVYAVHNDDGRFRICTDGVREGLKPGIRLSRGIRPFPKMIVSPDAPVAPSVGQLWHQTGVKAETSFPKLNPETFPRPERALRWDGAEWVITGLVTEAGGLPMKQGIQVCNFQEALASAHSMTKWVPCNFIYTYDGSTWGNA
jgi:hypothetical protein